MSGKAVIVVGELSGEIHAAELVRAVRKSADIAWSGIGSVRLAGAGVDIIHDYRDISLTGVSEVLAKAGRIWKAYRELKRHLIEKKPDLLVLVDFPGFNMRVARIARRLAIPTVYFIPPQVWAWRKGRIRQIKERVDLVLSILPFEEALYRRYGIPVKYVGHPFAQTVKPLYGKEEFFSLFRVKAGVPVVTVMPGSRQNEVKRHLPVLAEIVDRLGREIGPFNVLLPVAESVDEGCFAPLLRGRPFIIPVKGLQHDCLAHSDGAVIASGSATLEAAILGVPSVVLYRVSAMSYLIARMVVRVKHISLPNIIAGHEVFPEFVQSLDAEKIAKTVASMVNNDKSALRKEMEDLRKGLVISDRDPYSAAALEVLALLGRKIWPST